MTGEELESKEGVEWRVVCMRERLSELMLKVVRDNREEALTAIRLSQGNGLIDVGKPRASITLSRSHPLTHLLLFNSIRLLICMHL
jgi:hypothetical protein